MISKDFTYAVVGASNNEEKYGYKVLKDLHDAGYKVIPVNLKEDEILGIKVAHSLKDIKEAVDVIVTVVPPQVTLQIVKEAKKLGINNIWMQPGSENAEAIEYCNKNGMSCINSACIMVQRMK